MSKLRTASIFLLIYPRFSFRMLETCVIGLKFCTGPLKKVGPTDFFCFFEFRKSPSSTLRKFIEWRWLFLVNIFRISGEVCIMHESSDIMHASSDTPHQRYEKYWPKIAISTLCISWKYYLGTFEIRKNKKNLSAQLFLKGLYSWGRKTADFA